MLGRGRARRGGGGICCVGGHSKCLGLSCFDCNFFFFPSASLSYFLNRCGGMCKVGDGA